MDGPFEVYSTLLLETSLVGEFVPEWETSLFCYPLL